MWRRLSGVLLLALLVPSFCFSGELSEEILAWAMKAPREEVAATLSEAVKLLEMQETNLQKYAERLRTAEEKLEVSSANYESALKKQAREMEAARKKTGVKWGLYGLVAGLIAGGAVSLKFR